MQEVVACAHRHPPHGRGTVGMVQVHPNSRNVIPGRVKFSIDLRNATDALCEAMDADIRAVAAKLAASPGEKHGELKLALNRDFEPTDYFASDVYLRVIIDLLITKGTHATVVDYKTGKVKPDFLQLEMSTAVLAQYMPELETFTLAYLWLMHKNLSVRRHTRAELVKVWSDLIPRADKVETAIKTTDFPAKPSGLCGWCPVKTCPEWYER
jgi:hypothetical protein